MSIILSNKKSTSIHQILGTMAVQIGLVDIIKTLNIEPAAIIGLGFGELICGYFDGSLNLEQTIVASYEIALIFDKLDECNYCFFVGLGEHKVQ